MPTGIMNFVSLTAKLIAYIIEISSICRTKFNATLTHLAIRFLESTMTDWQKNILLKVEVYGNNQ